MTKGDLSCMVWSSSWTIEKRYGCIFNWCKMCCVDVRELLSALERRLVERRGLFATLSRMCWAVVGVLMVRMRSFSLSRTLSVVKNFWTSRKMVLFGGSGEFGYSLLNSVRTRLYDREFRYSVNMNTRWSVENPMITFQCIDPQLSLIMHLVDCGNHSTLFFHTSLMVVAQCSA